MKKTMIFFFSLLVLSCIIYLSSGEFLRYSGINYVWVLRQNLLYFTGVVAWLFMTLTMCLALRSSWLERLTHGLDKAWGLHKWTGITATVFSLAHWLDEKVPQWLVNAGWLAHPGELGDIHLSPWLLQTVEAALVAVTWTLYFMVALVLVSLAAKIPYRLFRQVHRLFPVVYLITAFHVMTVLFKSHWWETPAGYAVALVTVPGLYAALICLFRRVGHKNKHQGVIEAIYYHDGDLIEVVVKLDRECHYTPGQFAFLSFSHDLEPHPYTIASYGKDKTRLHFAIKSLGDYTRALASNLIVGQSACIEGPYGEFSFKKPASRQVWVAGGIGITPFLSQIDYLVESGGAGCPIDFWYCTSNDDSAFPQGLAMRCEKAGVTLHLVSRNAQRLNAEKIMATCSHDTTIKVWFCGPQAFSRSLLNGLISSGVSERSFYCDSFSMR